MLLFSPLLVVAYTPAKESCICWNIRYSPEETSAYKRGLNKFKDIMLYNEAEVVGENFKN